MTVEILHLYLSPGHNFFGHHGQPAGTNRIEEKTSIRCVAGKGIEGDRFFGHKEDYKGQITFLAVEVFEGLCRDLGVSAQPPSVLRRNVVVRGLDLNGLIGKKFTLQGVRFEGTAECSPCYWMDQAVGPGAEAWLKGRGGLRARVLSDGVLEPGVAACVVESDE